MYMTINRFFGKARARRSASAAMVGSPNLDDIRRSLHAALHDCKDMRTQRVLYRVNVAQTAAELWVLRSDLHQCIAFAHSQSEAAARINALIPLFEGRVPDSQLVPI